MREATRMLLIAIGLLAGLGGLRAQSGVVTEPTDSSPGTESPEAERLSAARFLPAQRALSPPRIDGLLDDSCWWNAPLAADFITTRPDPGKPSVLPTRIRVLYDDDALYIGAHLVDPSPDSIQVTLSRRDVIGNADWFGVLISPYRDGTNAFAFYLTAAGVQLDGKYTDFSEDRVWDAVWESAVRVGEGGWYAEMAIPYAALRFPTAQLQDWGINFMRNIRRVREDSWWSPVDIAEQGVVQQVGTLQGLREIRSPFRLSLSPYVSSFVELRSDPGSGSTETIWDVNGGMDLKYGINDAFTLDMTLVPDFNQVRFDNEVLNLSPFEVFFDENRLFFTEGTELFNKQGLFYSRRIGGRPIGYFDVFDQLEEGESVRSNPRESRLYNASKISGRLDSGLGIGVFNAVTAPSEAIITTADGGERSLSTAPLTNYSVVVLDQNLRRDNSYITFTNTQVWRSGHWTDAQVSALAFRMRDKQDRYQVEAWGAISQQYRDGLNNPELGHTTGLELSKVKGQVLFEAGYYEESDTYNPNDLGFLMANNERALYGSFNYNVYKPFWRFNQLYHNISYFYQRLYAPDAFAQFSLAGEATQIWNNFFASGQWLHVQPWTTYDWFEPRQPGRFLVYPGTVGAGQWISSDYRKALAIDARLEGRWFETPGRWGMNYEISPRWQVNDKVLLIPSFSRDRLEKDLGWVNTLDDGSIIIGERQVITSETGLQADYIFNNRMFLTLRVRHYWSAARYSAFYALDAQGMPGSSDYGTPVNGSDEKPHDVNFNAFTVDAVFTWRFAPGSDLFIVWKEGIFDAGPLPESNYFLNMRRTFQAPQSNNFSLRLVYWLDYVQVRKWTRRERAAQAALEPAGSAFGGRAAWDYPAWSGSSGFRPGPGGTAARGLPAARPGAMPGFAR